MKTKVKRVPFTFASSPLSESLEQARVASGALSDPVGQGNGVDEAVLFTFFYVRDSKASTTFLACHY